MMTPNQKAVFRVIEECAASGDEMPTGRQIAERSGIKITSVNSALYQLADAGALDIENLGYGKRIVTIMATGAATAHPSDLALKDRPSDSFAALVPPQRYPCPFCETRSDIGCKHITPEREYNVVSVGAAANRVLARMQVAG